jgi:voltage-gated potassium channel
VLVGRPTTSNEVRQEVWVMARFHPVERRFAAFMRQPLSVRKAMAVIVSATLASVLIGGVVISLFDSEEFPNVGIGLWWALQTVTTVGYGDVVPHDVAGRLIGAVIMLESIAFIAIVTAAITSSFVERARRERVAAASGEPDQQTAAQLAEQLAEITARLDRLQQSVDRLPGG